MFLVKWKWGTTQNTQTLAQIENRSWENFQHFSQIKPPKNTHNMPICSFWIDNHKRPFRYHSKKKGCKVSSSGLFLEIRGGWINRGRKEKWLSCERWGGEKNMASTLKQSSQNRKSTWTLKPHRGFKIFNKLTLKKTIFAWNQSTEVSGETKANQHALRRQNQHGENTAG